MSWHQLHYHVYKKNALDFKEEHELFLTLIWTLNFLSIHKWFRRNSKLSQLCLKEAFLLAA